jgi:hypothetical protein
LREPDEGYSRNALYALNFMLFVLMSKCKENCVKLRKMSRTTQVTRTQNLPLNGPVLVVYEKYIEMLTFR